MGNKLYYARKESDGAYVIRQDKYRDFLGRGCEHPHDLMAVSPTFADLKAMGDRYFGPENVDYSEIEQ